MGGVTGAELPGLHVLKEGSLAPLRHVAQPTNKYTSEKAIPVYPETPHPVELWLSLSNGKGGAQCSKGQRGLPVERTIFQKAGFL